MSVQNYFKLYRPNFKPMTMGADFTIGSYAIGVCNELRKALKGLVEESNSK
ncbi:MAG: hypothetical protein MJZ41_11860 [Bacteroidaceae bacterium]|nr:hypothetical protein [Bacteroidaceae bacterium]